MDRLKPSRWYWGVSGSAFVLYLIYSISVIFASVQLLKRLGISEPSVAIEYFGMVMMVLVAVISGLIGCLLLLLKKRKLSLG